MRTRRGARRTPGAVAFGSLEKEHDACRRHEQRRARNDGRERGVLERRRSVRHPRGQGRAMVERQQARD